MNITQAVIRNIDKQNPLFLMPSKEVAESDINSIFISIEMHNIIRFKNQKFWEKETSDHNYAKKIEEGFRLESVSEHSWHVADIVLLMAPLFPNLAIGKCLSFAILHDKLELYTGDFDPVGRSGKGDDTHAFCKQKLEVKIKQEQAAANKYLSSINELARDQQEGLIEEYIKCLNNEAKFVSAIDKLQAFCYVICKKKGTFSDKHIFFTVKYSRKMISFFPALINHYNVALNIFLDGIAKERRIDRKKLESDLFSQYEFDF